MQAVCGLAIVYLLRMFSRHLGFTKRGELGRAKEGEEGGGVGEGIIHPPPPSPFCLTPSPSNVFLIQDGDLQTLDGIFSARSPKIRLLCRLIKHSTNILKNILYLCRHDNLLGLRMYCH